MKELNPNHIVTATMHDHWYKLLAFVVLKYLPGREIVITTEDIHNAMSQFKGMPCVVANDQPDGMRISVVDEKEGRRLAKKAGGLPS